MFLNISQACFANILFALPTDLWGMCVAPGAMHVWGGQYDLFRLRLDWLRQDLYDDGGDRWVHSWAVPSGRLRYHPPSEQLPRPLLTSQFLRDLLRQVVRFAWIAQTPAMPRRWKAESQHCWHHRETSCLGWRDHGSDVDGSPRAHQWSNRGKRGFVEVPRYTPVKTPFTKRS